MNFSVSEQTLCDVKKCYECHIREFALFADLQQKDFDQIRVPIDELQLIAGESLYQEEDEPDYVYTICTGSIKLVHYLSNGSYKIVRLLYKGDLVGIEALGGGNYLQHAIAMQNTSVCRIAISEIDSINQHSQHLYKQMTRRWHNVQNDAHIWLTKFTVGSSRKRMANLLLYLAENSTEEYFYLPSREDIGALLSITSATASRIVAEFKRFNYIQIQGKEVSINRNLLDRI